MDNKNLLIILKYFCIKYKQSIIKIKLINIYIYIYIYKLFFVYLFDEKLIYFDYDIIELRVLKLLNNIKV